MKKTLFFLTILLFVGSAFAEITLNSDPIQIGQRNFSFSSRDLLYDQISNPSGDGVIAAQDFVDPSFDSYDCWGADDFEVPVGETWNIDAMDVLGGFWNGAGPGTGFGNLKIYEDAPGMPGTELFDVPACVVVDDGLGNLNITLSSVVTLTEGIYWVAWQYICEFAVGGQWGWQPHTDQYGTEFYWINPGNGFGNGPDWISSITQWPAFTDHDLSFALYGTIGGGTSYTLPFVEDFEGGVIPIDWSQEYVSGTEDWEYTYGVNGTHPADPHGGSFNAYFNGSTGNITKLITPQIDMGTATEVELKFWHAQQFWSPDQDFLRVYYKDSAAGAWTLLAEYLGDIPDWTEEVIILPNLSDDYYIAFEGEDGWGYGIGLDDISIEEAGGATFDPPINVAVDPELGKVTWLPPAVPVFFDDFDSYTAGEYLCTQTTDWIPWSGTPGGADDAYVSDEQANSAPNSVKIEGAASDIIHMFGNLTTGHYIVSFQYYVATGCGGYFNLMHDFTGESRDDLRNEWAIESYFSTDGSGYINAGGSSSATFTYPNGAWFECMIDIDLDSDLAEYYVNGVFVHGWQWSLQATGSAGMCQLGVVDFFAAAPTGETVTYYFDDFTLLELSSSEVLTGYNVYL
ncbi:MAG: hypothetical protein K8R49_06765, partial [Candidatus Cloacimonetes bacterium]|nr:hypothetical protein [Candidatus Cloacimonadota bacterium]